MGEQATYDPVVAARPGSGGGVGTPPPGRALVLVPVEGVLTTVRPGEPVPAGRWQAVFTVDVTEHRLVLPVHLPRFDVRVVVRCEVADPALIVGGAVRDVGSTLYGAVRDLVSAAAAAVGDRAGPDAAAAAIDAALLGLTGDAAVRVRDARAAVSASAAPAAPAGEVVSRDDPPPVRDAPGRASGNAPARASGDAPGRASRVRGTAPGPGRASRVRGTGTDGGGRG